MVALQKMGIHPGQKSFDHNKGEYICRTMFCGRNHCLTEAKKIAISRSLCLFIVVAFLLYYTFLWGFNHGVSLALCQQVVEFLCVFALLKGITKVLPHCLLPFMVFAIFQSIGVLSVAIYCIIEGYFPLDLISNHFNQKVANVLEEYITIPNLLLISEVVCILASIIFYWHFLVVKRCYRYLQDVRQHLDKNRGIKPIS